MGDDPPQEGDDDAVRCREEGVDARRGVLQADGLREERREVEHAEQKALSTIGQYKHLKAKKSDLIIAVCGCMTAQAHRVEELKNSYPYVDFTFAPSALDRFPEYLCEVLDRHGRNFHIGEAAGDIREGVPILRNSSTKAWVSIMYGCNNFCSYCIVPYVRGRERSRQPEDILQECRALIAQGYKEITLLGQNVNSYGKDLGLGVDFADLMAQIASLPGDFRLRFMTSHPKDASHKLFDTIAAYPKICKQFHLPFQSGNDRVLHAMNRRYTSAQYLELVDYGRSLMPELVLTSDVIVGFPGETEEDFAATLDLIREVGYMQLFTFIYSKRAGTPAAKLPDPTTHAEKAARMDRLLKTQEEFAFAATAAMAGRTVRVLVEAAGRNEGTVNGRLDNNLVVEFKAPESLIGQWADVHITGSRAALLVGELAE